MPNPPKPITLKRPLNALAIMKQKGAAALQMHSEDHLYTKKPKRKGSKKNGTRENIPPHPSVNVPIGHEYSKGTRGSRTRPNQPSDESQAMLDEPEASGSQDINDSVDIANEGLIQDLRRKIRALRKQLCAERKRNDTVMRNVKRFLNPDQIRCLGLKSRKSNRWSNETIKSALKIRCATGAQGYDHLVKEGFPLPAYRTLCEKVENAQFHPGVQHDVFQWLKVKIDALPAMGKDCVLALDEIQLRQTIEYDRGKRFGTR